jgi:hypothetical protein
MKLEKKILVLSILFFILDINFKIPLSVAKERCGDTQAVEASKSTRVLDLKKFGIRVKISSNFRTMLRNDGSVSILDPGTFEALRCAAPHGIYDFNIKLIPNPKRLSLVQIARNSYISKLGQPVNLDNYNFKNTQALIIYSEGSYGAYGIFNVPGKGVVEMSAACDCEIDKTDIIRYLEVTELIN